MDSGLSTTGPDITPCRSNYYKSYKKCDINVKEYRNAGLLQNKSTRVAKYLIPVIIVSVLLNIPKFLETSVAYDEETGEVIIFTFYTRFVLLNIYFLCRFLYLNFSQMRDKFSMLKLNALTYIGF